MSRHSVPRSKVDEKLASLATDDGRYAILAIDHGRSLLNMLGHDNQADDAILRESKSAVLKLLGKHCTAVLIDFRMAETIGDVWHPPVGVPLIVGVDELDYDDLTFPPPNLPTHELLQQLRDVGASAFKIVLYYDPESSDAAARCAIVAEVVDRCHHVGLPLLVEPLPIPITGPVERPPWPVDEVARQVSGTGADILKLPIALSAQTAKIAGEITKAAAGTPWILLSSGVPYSEFLETLRVALGGGAAGFAAGRSIWNDLIVDVTNEAARSEASDRLEKAAILTQSTRRGNFT